MTISVDEWCALRVGEGPRMRGRLIGKTPTHLVFVQPGPIVHNFYVSSADARGKIAHMEDGTALRWTRQCSCNQPASLKGLASKLLETVQA